MKKSIIQIALSLIIVILVYFVYESIMEPVRFNKENNRRRTVIIDKLKDIRTLQLAYKAVNGTFSNSFDTLANFVKNDRFPVVLMNGNVPDSLTETQAMAMGLITRDSSFVNVSDSLFTTKGEFYVDSLHMIPFSSGERFALDASEIERGMIKVQVFEASAQNKQFLKDLKKELYKGDDLLRVGSMTEPSVDGNWE